MAPFAVFIAIAVTNKYTIFFKLLAAFIAAFVTIIIIAVKPILIIVFLRLSLPITAATAFFLLLEKVWFSFSDKFARFVKKIGLKQINRIRRRKRIKPNSRPLLSGLIGNFIFYNRYKIENN